jgi:hypothetical protein
VFERVVAGTEKFVDADEVFSGPERAIGAGGKTALAEPVATRRILYAGRSLDLASD